MFGSQRKRIALGTTAVAGVFALAACGSSGSTAAGQPQQPGQAGAGSAVAAGGGGAANPVSAQETPRCTTDDLSAELGAPEPVGDAAGQYELPLVYTNISGRDCQLYGVPGADLLGPEHAMGTTYSLPRIDNGAPVNQVAPGQTATASITVLAPGESDDPGWTPSHLETIPPGSTESFVLDWPADLPVLRQDGATRPGSWVNGILADPA
ncbi:DUF4232 domain-containing protein [Amycolatopsis sp. 195334CR]|uniref:DUF4232 domain-containing protein n=1 Tax=Amycolatopsis sp. 195334CR TaxID=2814588 RepID=UPI001A8F73DD|nr:DUF4232 domain-containing protein [Amycolatopsis sp. 195334CR]MBN6038946.1 DUF4232 domain-containing protein [Amycolatopsis sp. 195334CR]